METINTLTCLVCFESFPNMRRGIKCSYNHYYCHECSPSYITSMFHDPNDLIPAKCSDPKCDGTIEFEDIQRYMNIDQIMQYNMYCCFTDISKDEKKMDCPLGCGYSEIWNKDDLSNLFYCKNMKCQKGTCLVCNKQFFYPKDVGNLTLEEMMQMETEDWVETHMNDCGKHMEHIKNIKEIINNGNKRLCPNCGKGGRKDSGCNRICCTNCHLSFCYFCGKSEKDCDKEDPDGNIYRHFDNWKTNDKRCPAWMIWLNEYDGRWPKDDSGCQDRLHKIIIFTQLREYASRIGIEVFTSIIRRFPEIGQEGCDLSNLFTMDLTLIKRK